MKILFDTNVILDVLLQRQPFYQDSFRIFQFVDDESVNGCLTATTITDIFYMLRKAGYSPAEVYLIIDELVGLFTVAPVIDITIASALALRWKDFEDAVQCMVAEENEVAYIITRDTAGYEKSSIPCMTPAEFILSFEKQE